MEATADVAPVFSRRLSLPTPSWRVQQQIAAIAASERTPLIRSRSVYDVTEAEEFEQEKKPLGGGTILGIHNLAVVIPQFVVRDSFVSRCQRSCLICHAGGNHLQLHLQHRR